MQAGDGAPPEILPPAAIALITGHTLTNKAPCHPHINLLVLFAGLIPPSESNPKIKFSAPYRLCPGRPLTGLQRPSLKWIVDLSDPWHPSKNEIGLEL